ncbi:MAG: hypothetical protein HC876_18135 [Chloroflexaceae bacterium]|nr:hypothetical protein [Chloroflexaceae bacterium]
MQTIINQYLHIKGFQANPFATTNAEQEVDRLPSFFVRLPWFDWLVGEPQHPESLIVFAPRGYGKTSHRLEVARIASDPQREHRALAVIFDDVHSLLHQGTDQVSLENTYLPFLRRKTLQALKEQLEKQRTYLNVPQPDPETLARLHALLRLYAPRRPFSIPADEHDIATLMQEYRNTTLSPREWLREELSVLAARAGFASVYVLIDGLDEASDTREHPDIMLKLLDPLVSAPGLLQGCGFAFKFFLPDTLEQPMHEHNIGRLDRIPHRSFAWDANELMRLFALRLQTFSREEGSMVSRINSFQDVCEATFDVDASMVQAACCSPRRLIDVARDIVEKHCERHGAADKQIGEETIISVLDMFLPACLLLAASPNRSTSTRAANCPIRIFHVASSQMLPPRSSSTHTAMYG